MVILLECWFVSFFPSFFPAVFACVYTVYLESFSRGCRGATRFFFTKEIQTKNKKDIAL